MSVYHRQNMDWDHKTHTHTHRHTYTVTVAQLLTEEINDKLNWV